MKRHINYILSTVFELPTFSFRRTQEKKSLAFLWRQKENRKRNIGKLQINNYLLKLL